jgi:hypothetical protein
MNELIILQETFNHVQKNLDLIIQETPHNVKLDVDLLIDKIDTNKSLVSAIVTSLIKKISNTRNLFEIYSGKNDNFNRKRNFNFSTDSSRYKGSIEY